MNCLIAGGDKDGLYPFYDEETKAKRDSMKEMRNSEEGG